MKVLKKIIRNILFEIFDSYELPKEYTENNNIFTFKNNDIEYYVKFTPFEKVGKTMVTDEGILNKINLLNHKYVIDFGIVENHTLRYDVKTNKNNPIEIMKYIIGINIKFIQDNKVNVLTYVPNSDLRDKMFNKIVENFAQDFIRYRAKENSSYNVFLIKNNI